VQLDDENNLVEIPERLKAMLAERDDSSEMVEDSDEERSSDLRSMMSAEEIAIFNEIYEEDDQITSGYSTISSSKEEEYLNRHLANQSAVAAAKARATAAA